MSNPNWGSIPIMVYPINAEEINPPANNELLITDNSLFILTDGTPLNLAGF